MTQTIRPKNVQIVFWATVVVMMSQGWTTLAFLLDHQLVVGHPYDGRRSRINLVMSDTGMMATSDHTTSSSTTTALFMGGYYSEPESTSINDQTQTHMVFGVRCREVRTRVHGETIVGLQPEESNDNAENGEVDDEISDQDMEALIQHLASSALQGKHVLEVGASSCLSLAACLALGASSVTVCHPDPQRLRLIEHALLLLNHDDNRNNNNNNHPCSFQTQLLQADTPLPQADIVVVTSPVGRGWKNRLDEAVSKASREMVLVPASRMAPLQLHERNPQPSSRHGAVVQIPSSLFNSKDNL